MDQKTVDAVIQLGRVGKTQYGISKQLNMTQTVVAHILNEDRRGTKAAQITEQLNKKK